MVAVRLGGEKFFLEIACSRPVWKQLSGVLATACREQFFGSVCATAVGKSRRTFTEASSALLLFVIASAHCVQIISSGRGAAITKSTRPTATTTSTTFREKLLRLASSTSGSTPCFRFREVIAGSASSIRKCSVI